jgi:hypothetical protein
MVKSLSADQQSSIVEVLRPMSVTEIEAAITRLSPEELAELLAWISEYHARVWDQQIEQDLEDGRLDSLLAEVDREYEEGLATPL